MSDYQSPQDPQETPPRKVHQARPFAILAGVFALFAILLSLVPASLMAQTNSTPKPGTGTSTDQNSFSNLQQVYRFILNNYADEVDPQILIEGAFKGMFESLKDPYSVYLTKSDMRELNDTTSGEFGGIGAYIDKERDKDGNTKIDGYIEIAAPIEDTPAFLADFQSGDLIMTINDEDTTPLTVDEAVKRLRGVPGTDLTLKILRGKAQPFNVKLRREVIQVPTEKSAMIGTVAYIRLIQFTPHTAERFEAAYKKLSANNPSGLIIDLRNNPGGVLDAPLEIADMFFDDGIILSTRGRMTGESQEFRAESGKLVPESLPVIVLVNGGSASASEILSGALKDRGRAILVGETTFGKGLVQRVIPLAPGDHGFKLTTSRYYTPSGVSINKIGIKPDVEVLDEVLGTEEANDLVALREQGLIGTFLDSFPQAGTADIKKFTLDLAKKGIDLKERWIERLVKTEKNRRSKATVIYDDEYDTQLIKALEMVQVWGTIKRVPNKGQAAKDLPSPAVPSPKP